jgi:peptide/nickel transport system ATP-binding protein
MLLGVLGPDGGEVTLQREPWSALTDRERRPNRRKVGTVNQDALGSFDPRHRVGQVIADALPRGGTREQRNARVLDLLRHVGLGEENLERRPLLLSGGQRQRVAIAKALAADPEILVLDEPVSSLDASVQAQVLDLLTDLQDEFGTTYVFISHDFGVIEHLCDRVIVMRDGLVVEEGDINDVFTAPEHEYTKELLSAVPRLTTIEEGAR